MRFLRINELRTVQCSRVVAVPDDFDPGDERHLLSLEEWQDGQDWDHEDVVDDARMVTPLSTVDGDVVRAAAMLTWDDLRPETGSG